jgi:hypothetical protein
VLCIPNVVSSYNPVTAVIAVLNLTVVLGAIEYSNAIPGSSIDNAILFEV